MNYVIQRGTGEHQSNRVYSDTDETSVSVQARDWKEPIKIVEHNQK